MKKYIKLVLVTFIIAIIYLIIMNNSVEAASTSFSASPKTVEVGDTITVQASVTAAQWDLAIKVNGSTLTSSTELDNYTSNITKNFSATYVAKEKGTLTFSLEGDITDFDQTNTSVNKTSSVTVKEKATTTETNTTNTTETEKPTETKPTEEKPEEPKVNFSSVNQTVYATDSVNVRSGPSTSSKIVGSLSKGDSIKRTGVGDNGWSRVSYNGTTAYISSTYLTTTKPKEEKKAEEKKNEEVNNTVAKNEQKNEENTSNVNKNEAIANIIGSDIEEEYNSKLKLKELLIEGVVLSPSFDKDIYEYTVTLDTDEKKELNITATPENEKVSVEIVGNTELEVGKNIITIILKSKEDEEETATYQITVNVPEMIMVENNNKIVNEHTYKYIILTIAVIVLILIVLIIIRGRKNNKYLEEDDDDELYENLDKEENQEKDKDFDNEQEELPKEDEEFKKSKPGIGKGKHSV